MRGRSSQTIDIAAKTRARSERVTVSVGPGPANVSRETWSDVNAHTPRTDGTGPQASAAMGLLKDVMDAGRSHELRLPSVSVGPVLGSSTRSALLRSRRPTDRAEVKPRAAQQSARDRWVWRYGPKSGRRRILSKIFALP